MARVDKIFEKIEAEFSEFQDYLSDVRNALDNLSEVVGSLEGRFEDLQAEVGEPDPEDDYK